MIKYLLLLHAKYHLFCFKNLLMHISAMDLKQVAVFAVFNICFQEFILFLIQLLSPSTAVQRLSDLIRNVVQTFCYKDNQGYALCSHFSSNATTGQ